MKKNKQLDGIILMGPFGSGKSYLGKRLNELGVAEYRDLEPIIYATFGLDDDFNLEEATKFLRATYYEQLSSQTFAVFESTGVVQRPLLLEVMAKYNIALVRVCTPKAICIERVIKRNTTQINPIEREKAEDFFDYWTNEIAPTYEFALEVDGTDEQSALTAIYKLMGE